MVDRRPEKLGRRLQSMGWFETRDRDAKTYSYSFRSDNFSRELRAFKMFLAHQMASYNYLMLIQNIRICGAVGLSAERKIVSDKSLAEGVHLYVRYLPDQTILELDCMNQKGLLEHLSVFAAHGLQFSAQLIQHKIAAQSLDLLENHEFDGVARNLRRMLQQSTQAVGNLAYQFEP